MTNTTDREEGRGSGGLVAQTGLKEWIRPSDMCAQTEGRKLLQQARAPCHGRGAHNRQAWSNTAKAKDEGISVAIALRAASNKPHDESSMLGYHMTNKFDLSRPSPDKPARERNHMLEAPGRPIQTTRCPSPSPTGTTYLRTKREVSSRAAARQAAQTTPAKKDVYKTP